MAKNYLPVPFICQICWEVWNSVCHSAHTHTHTPLLCMGCNSHMCNSIVCFNFNSNSFHYTSSYSVQQLLILFFPFSSGFFLAVCICKHALSFLHKSGPLFLYIFTALVPHHASVRCTRACLLKLMKRSPDCEPCWCYHRTASVLITHRNNCQASVSGFLIFLFQCTLFRESLSSDIQVWEFM